MTEVKKIGLSGIIVALAALVALTMMAKPAHADFDGLMLVAPSTGVPAAPGNTSGELINAGNLTHLVAYTLPAGGPEITSIQATITPVGPGPALGSAYFMANGQQTLTCLNDDPGCDFNPTWSPGDPVGQPGFAIRTAIRGTHQGQVRIDVIAYNGVNVITGSPKSIVLTIVGSEGAVVTVSPEKDSIGRPMDIGGWAGPGEPFNESDVTVNVKDTLGNNINGVWVGIATIAQASGNQTNLQLASADNGWTWTHGMVWCQTGSGGSCTVESRATNNSPLGTHTYTAAVVDDHPVYGGIGLGSGYVGGGQANITVAGPPENVVWTVSDPQGAATSQDVHLKVTDEDGRNAWTGLRVDTDAGDGSFLSISCTIPSIRNGEAQCKYLSTGTSTQPAILAVLIGGGLYSEHQIGAIIPGPTPPTGEWTIIPVSGGLTITSYTGSLAALAADGGALNLVSCAATVGGNFVVHIFGAPSFVNTAFATQFAGGLDAQGLICRRA